ncbi:hypothetical protein [Methylorubrum populi]|uniref:Uncharacterized protein n=1 Tax=Methylorubrum populi TaxID=223967 RepID=A0A833J9Y2_9HYPH|nr:hypothetical protein [Methylorubrum populi]KAB7788018.1 hypothetical protein F8B43_0023 [Methylorubrum populi]
MSSYRIPAKPTTYAGTRFRSRLEARWAAFFDLAGWRWEYEPVDYPGWQPDFLIRTSAEPIPVEVKPIEWPDSGKFEAMEKVVLGRGDLEKVRAIEGVECLILGAYLPTFAAGLDGVPFGLTVTLNSNDEGAREHFVDVALLFGGQRSAFDFSVEFGSWHRRIGVGGGKADLPPIEPQAVEAAWRQAGNVVQWRGR